MVRPKVDVFAGWLSEVRVVTSRAASNGLVKTNVHCKSDFADTDDAGKMYLWTWSRFLKEGGYGVDICIMLVDQIHNGYVKTLPGVNN